MLGLAGNTIGDRGAVALVFGLQHNATLETVDLSSNRVREYMLHSSGQSPISHDVAIPVDVSLTSVGSEPGGVEGALPPSMCPLVPSDPETQAEHKVEVAYWLRLILKGAAVEAGVEGNKYWTTHPLLLEPSTEAGSV